MAVIALEKRRYICGQDAFGNYEYCNSTWDNWGRWVALVVIIFTAFLIFFVLACISARRRRRIGQQPFYGTGWVGRAPWGQNTQYNQQPYYSNNQPQAYNQSAPPYAPTENQAYYGQSQSYYAGQQNGIELQQPDPAHQYARGGDNVYEPPNGPPPKKGDGIVR